VCAKHTRRRRILLRLTSALEKRPSRTGPAERKADLERGDFYPARFNVDEQLTSGKLTRKPSPRELLRTQQDVGSSRHQKLIGRAPLVFDQKIVFLKLRDENTHPRMLSSPPQFDNCITHRFIPHSFKN
jgi:hypothetical protein